MFSNNISEESTTGLVNSFSVSHIIKIDEYLLYICANDYISQDMYHAIYLYKYIIAALK